MLIATVAHCLLAKYGIPESPNLHIRCLCHVVNLVVQAILCALGEAEDPEANDYYDQNKNRSIHFDANTDPDQVELDNEEFLDIDDKDEEPLSLEEEEKRQAQKSCLSKV